jgi:hypothetical protein
MKTRYLIGLAVLMAGCSGGQTSGGDDGGQSQAQLKQAAAEAKASGNAQGDVCAAKGWYGDHECDTFCPELDSVDCTPNAPGGAVHCAEFVETANGYCSRKAEDPCINQDPDCDNAVGPEPMPTEPIACTLISQLPDGVCKTDPNDPCVRYSDPDCSPDGGNSGSGTPSDPGSVPGGTPTDPGTPGSTPPSEPTDPGVPSSPPDPGTGTPPGAVCAAYIQLPDGVCSRDPADPCIFQDPDCVK